MPNNLSDFLHYTYKKFAFCSFLLDNRTKYEHIPNHSKGV